MSTTKRIVSTEEGTYGNRRLVAATVKHIPVPVLEEGMKKAEGLWEDRRHKRWYYTAPVVFICGVDLVWGLRKMWSIYGQRDCQYTHLYDFSVLTSAQLCTGRHEEATPVLMLFFAAEV